MTYVAVGIAGAQLVGGIVAGASAKKKRKKAEEELRVQGEAQKKQIGEATAAQQRAEYDLAHEYQGQSVIDPEAQYAKSQVERSTASAIDKATRSGASSNEIMSAVTGLTSKGQLGVQKVTAEQNARRRQLMIASKGAAIKAAQTGLAGAQAKINIDNQIYGKTMQKDQQINQTVGQNYGYFQGALGDLSSAMMFNKLYGGADSGFGKPSSADLKKSKMAGVLSSLPLDF